MNKASVVMLIVGVLGTLANVIWLKGGFMSYLIPITLIVLGITTANK